MVESLQNESRSSHSSEGGNASGSNSGSFNVGYNNSEGSSESNWTEEQTTLIGGGNVNIDAKRTEVHGAVVANAVRNGDTLTDLGNLNLITDELIVTDLHDTDVSENSGINMSVSVSVGSDKKGSPEFSGNSSSLGLTNQGHRKEQTTAGTLGGGSITRRDGSEYELGDTNRDLDQRQVVTLDQQTGGLDATFELDHRVLSKEGLEDIGNDFELTGQAVGQVADATIDGVDYVADEIAVLGDDLPEELREQLGETGERFVDELIREDLTDEQISEVLQREKLKSALGGLEESDRQLAEDGSQPVIQQQPSDTDASGNSAVFDIPDSGQMDVIVVQADPDDYEVSAVEKGTASLGYAQQEINELTESNPEVAKGVEVAIAVATGGPVKAAVSELTNQAIAATVGDDIAEAANTVVNHAGGLLTGGTADEFADGVKREEQNPGSRSSELGKSDVDIRDGLVFAGSVLLGIDGMRGGGKGPN